MGMFGSVKKKMDKFKGKVGKFAKKGVGKISAGLKGLKKTARGRAAGNMLGGSSEQGGMSGGPKSRLRSSGFGTVGYMEE